MIPPADRVKRIVSLGLPIMAGMSTHVILGVVDMVFVGFIGTAAIGAVGLASFFSFIYLGFFWGGSVAVQATVSRLKGQGQEDRTAEFLNAAILLVLLTAPASSLILVLATPWLLPLMNDDPSVLNHGIPYLQWLIASGTFVGINAAFGGFWNATDRSRIYMRVVMATGLLNIPLNYIFIFGPLGLPAFGVTGAGIGTALASVLGTLYYFYFGVRYARQNGFLHRRPALSQMNTLIRLAIPSGSQQVIECLTLSLMYKIVGLIGTAQLAVFSVLMNLINMVGLPAWGLGIAGATLVGQALGRDDTSDASAWAWDVVKVGLAAMALLGIPLWLLSDSILAIFIHDPEVRIFGIWPCRILGIMIVFNGIGYILSAMLNGAGDVKRVMYVNVCTQYFLLLPGAILLGPYLGFGLMGVWAMHQFGFRAVQSGIFIYMWRRRRWANIRFW
ncbi:MAG: MATE family efflux transporter [Pseudomonadales bacterium]|jgi:putative MATE family efflux protein|nr:MATE family efflux transporter [Pseudomonadales bacterium]MDP7597050.1 MATE family efflux transporter [Pseudomonadales bacterium]HJN53180.1 MATE family efflux transporter [Pseudomonadales bacterium]|tara:strand:+ start:8359 stop:9693 length:1335 start_codon:yes stop_codon:yes gene_type:complete